MTDDPAYPTKIFATRSGTWKMGDDMGVEYIRWDIAARGDYHEGIQEGWKAGAVQEQRIWRMAIERYFDGTAVADVEKYVEEIRKGVEGE